MKTYFDHQPSVLEAVGNGSWRFRYNIEQNIVEEESGDYPQWVADEVIVWDQPTSNKILEAIINATWPAGYEQKLINEYNAATLGLYGSASSTEAKAHKQAYKDFLQHRATLKIMVDATCIELGIL